MFEKLLNEIKAELEKLKKYAIDGSQIAVEKLTTIERLLRTIEEIAKN